MASVKPLRLKVQRTPKYQAIAAESGIAKVIVDTGIFHLSGSYDYTIPEELSDQVQPGVLVQVPFGSKICLGYVIARAEVSTGSIKLKSIKKVSSPIPIFGVDLQNLLGEVAARFAGGTWDLIRSAIPPRVAKVESEFAGRSLSDSITEPKPGALRSILKRSSQTLVEEIIEATQAGGEVSQVLVIVPDEREIEFLRDRLSSIAHALYLSAKLDKSERYRNFLHTLFDSPRLVIGTRSAIFTPLKPGSAIIILSDGDESMYERRAPGWNVREVAFIRSKIHFVTFLSASPSLEVYSRISGGRSAPLPKRTFHFEGGRVTDIGIIKAGLKKGNVLVVITQPGYVHTFACQKCRNIATCGCGGRLEVSVAQTIPLCALCGRKFSEWSCKWCNNQVKRIVSKGSDRYAEEFGKAIPGHQVLISKGASRIDILPQNGVNSVLVVATYGCEPIGDYAALVLLSLENFSNRTTLRASEEARSRIFDDIALVVPAGEVYLALPPDHPIARAISKNPNLAPYDLAAAEIAERDQTNLPPNVLLASVAGSAIDIAHLARSLADSELFFERSMVAIDSKFEAQSKLILRTHKSKESEFAKFFTDLARYRSLKGLAPFSIRLEPYSI